MNYTAGAEKTEEQIDYIGRIKDGFVSKHIPFFYCVVTYGCQQNEADSEMLSGMLTDMGCTQTNDVGKADLIVVNTCTVREHASQKALSVTGAYKHLKSIKPELIICMCGCMVSTPESADIIKKSYPYISIVFGTEELFRFPEILYGYLKGGKRLFFPNKNEPEILEGLPVKHRDPYKAFVSIMYGCNNFCTYCIVPYVRGRERSRKPENILSQIKKLVESGCKEITLLGQNVNSYGKEFGTGYDFSDLLNDICKIKGDFIVRFMTSHPKDASQKLINTIYANEKIERHLHLPIQSGSDRILSVMNRHYTRDEYFDFVKRLRQKVPDISLSTDIMVGFPGETEDDFADTLSMLSLVKFDMIFSFIYSKRKNTPAARMTEQIPENIKSERFKRLTDTQARISLERNLSLEGSVTRVLVEGESKTDPDELTGRNSQNKIILFKGDKSLAGSFADIKITKAQTFMLWGEVCKGKAETDL